MDRDGVSDIAKAPEQETGKPGPSPDSSVKAWKQPVEPGGEEPLDSLEDEESFAGEPFPDEADFAGEAGTEGLQDEQRQRGQRASGWYDRGKAHGRWDGEGVKKWRCEDDRAAGRRESLIRPADGLIAAFFIPVIIMVVIFAQRGIFPFGEESFLRTDMYHQYAPFFSEFSHKLKSGESLFYSWDIGMGVNFAALYAYYLASPVNWLLILCPREYIIEFMTYSIVLKIGLSGLTFAWYLRKHNHTSDFGVGFFGIFYALSGYMAAYSWNIMWLDCIWCFPLIMLGVERLVKERKGILYCVALGLSILSNYYISIMICLFLVIYFICLLILEGRRKLRDFFVSAGQFAFYSLLAGGMAAVVLLPEIYALQSTASGDFNFPRDYEAYFSIFDMLARHIGNVETEIGLDHWPNIYCGIAVFLFFLLYLACRKISVKEKAVYCGLLLMFYLSFSINVLNFIWHGFHYPNSLPCRQSFIYIFLMLALCYRAYMYLKQASKKQVAVAFWGSVCYVLLAQKLVTEEAYHFIVFYVAILLLAAYTGLIWFYKNPGHTRTAAALLTLGVVAVEAAANMTVTSVTTTSRTAYKADNDDVIKLTGGLAAESSFYRVDKVGGKTKNDGAWMNFPTVSLFSSVASAEMTDFFKSVGCEGSTNAYSIVGSTPLVDSLFSVRYALYEEKQENPRISLKEFSGETYLYENPYTLPVGFMLPEGVEENWKLDMPNPADVQNDLCDILRMPLVLAGIYAEGYGTTFSFTPQEDGEYYISILNKRVKSIRILKGESTQTLENINRGYLVELGYLKAGETVTVKNEENSEELNARAYLFEPGAMRAVYEKLNAHPLHVTRWEDTQIEGTVDVPENGMLFLSIPYDTGWEIEVDGAAVPARKALGAFLGVELLTGRHTVRLSYYPPGLKEGALISAVCLFLFLSVILAGYSMRKRKKAPSPYDKLDQEWYGPEAAPGEEGQAEDADESIQEEEREEDK